MYNFKAQETAKTPGYHRATLTSDSITILSRVTITQVVEREASDRKFAASRVDFRIGNALLCPWERHLTIMLPSGQISLPVAMTQNNERLANRTHRR